MTMTPDRFRQLLDDDTGDAPPAPHLSAAVEAGRSRLRRRRIASAGAAALAVVVVTGGVGLATRGSDQRAVEPVQTPDAALVEACQQGPRDQQESRDLLYEAGTPLVRSAATTDFQTVVALESADATYWAECTIARRDAEFPATMDVYWSDPARDTSGISEIYRSYVYSTGCGLVNGALQPDCPTWVLAWVDRLPDAVGSVRFELADGTSTTVPSEGGYVVLNHLHERTAAITLDSQGYVDVPNPISRITYVDGDGTPIAAEAYDQSSPRPLPVDGLPQLSAYPDLRGEVPSGPSGS